MYNITPTIIIIGVLAVLGVGAFIYRRSRVDSEWSGTVTDKNAAMMGAVSGGVGVLNQNGTLTVKTDNGKTKSIMVSQGIYEEFKIGDKIKKHRGDINPSKS